MAAFTLMAEDEENPETSPETETPQSEESKAEEDV